MEVLPKGLRLTPSVLDQGLLDKILCILKFCTLKDTTAEVVVLAACSDHDFRLDLGTPTLFLLYFFLLWNLYSCDLDYEKGYSFFFLLVITYN